MFKSNYELLIEACKGEKCDSYSFETDTVKSQFKALCADLENMDVEVGYIAPMVPVIQSNFTNEYYVDSEDLSRLAIAQEMSLEDAFYAVVAENGLSPEQLIVMIESEEEIMDLIIEAKGNSKKLGVINAAAKKLEEMKKKGINLKKKKSKKK